MKNLKSLITCSFLFVGLTCFSQFKTNNFGGYMLSVRVDSSHFFVIGGQPSKAEKVKYATEDRSQGYVSYSNEATLWTNAYLYNDSTQKLIKIFDSPLIGVYPVLNMMPMLRADYNYTRTIPSGVTKENIVFAVKTDDYNKDGVLDADDPVYLFISKKDGTDCKQITPNGVNVTNWKLTKNGMGILLTAQTDKNGDKKFTEDEELHQIDLNADISKIKIKPVVVSK